MITLETATYLEDGPVGTIVFGDNSDTYGAPKVCIHKKDVERESCRSCTKTLNGMRRKIRFLWCLGLQVDMPDRIVSPVDYENRHGAINHHGYP